MRKSLWSAVLLCLALTTACKKKEEQKPAEPAKTTAAEPAKAVEPTKVEESKPTEETRPAEPTKPAEETKPAETAAAEPKAQVTGNVKGTDIQLNYAYARIEKENKVVELVLTNKKVFENQVFLCDLIETQSDGNPLLYVDIPTGPKGDLFVGKTIRLDPMEILGNEGDWSVNQENTEVTITKVDLANRSLEGNIRIVSEDADEKGTLQGSFVAQVCTAEGVEMKLEPSAPAPVDTPLAWKVKDTEVKPTNAIARLVAEEGKLPYWEILIATAPITCDTILIEEGHGLDLRLYRRGDSFPLNEWQPTTEFAIYADPAATGAKPDSRMDDLDETQTFLMVTEIGEGENAVLKGNVTFAEHTIWSPVEGQPFELVISGGGTFEAKICPPEQ